MAQCLRAGGSRRRIWACISRQRGFYVAPLERESAVLDDGLSRHHDKSCKQTIGRVKKFSDIIVAADRKSSFSLEGPRNYATFLQLVERACTRFSKDGHNLQSLPRQRGFINWRHISSTAASQHQEIGMPSLSPTMTQGNIARWLKKEGDQVAPGDVLCEIETDKATLEMEAMDEGFLAKILCGDGSKEIPVGQPIAVVVDSQEEIANLKDYKAETGGSSGPPPKEDPPLSEESSQKSEPSKSKSEPAMPSVDDRVFASPLAQKIAEERNVPLTSLKGTGPDGRIIKADVDEFSASGAAAGPRKSVEKPLQSIDFTDMPNTQIRRITAQRLLLSKQTIPHYYLTIATQVDSLLALRSKLNNVQEASSGKRISINDFVLKAAAMALRKVPECNSSWTDEYIRQYHNINISVAIQTDFGLLVPVVQNADKKGLAAIAENMKTLADNAKKNSLKPVDYEGGTFTVSNLGGPFGVKQFCAIINPPQACILAVGTTDKRVVSDSKGGFTTATYMSATLSCDHRVVDGAIGARWLGAFKSYIEDPVTLLL